MSERSDRDVLVDLLLAQQRHFERVYQLIEEHARLAAAERFEALASVEEELYKHAGLSPALYRAWAPHWQDEDAARPHS